jgi:hypothetical protein
VNLLKKNFNVLLIVSHPDDEVIWFGGLLSILSRLDYINLYILCLSGNNARSRRKNEFNQIMSKLKCRNFVFLRGQLKRSDQQISGISSKLFSALAVMRLNIIDLDLIVTHSPFGDEHAAPHHIQVSNTIFSWCRLNQVSFSFFSCIQLNNISHISLITNFKLLNDLILLNYSKCTQNLKQWIINNALLSPIWQPKYFMQFFIRNKSKNKMLLTYKSIDVSAHKKAYIMASSPVEAIYFFDASGRNVFMEIVKRMSVPGAKILFPHNKIVRNLLS